MLAAMPRGHHHGALAAALVAGALDLLDAGGVNAVTIRAVARRAGVSHAAPVNHFSDRRALLTAVAVACFDRVHALIIDAGAADLADPRERLHAIADAAHSFGLGWPNRYRLMWRADLLDAADPALVARTTRLFDMMADAVRPFDGPVGASKASRTIAVCAVIHGYIMLRIDGNFDAFNDEQTGAPRHRALLDVLIPPGD